MTFNFYGGNEGNELLKYLLDLRSFDVNKLLEDGTLLQKHVEVSN